ncbi:MAG: DMT family transporter [Clostridia bacterium]|nr:DMT family transporter [Clostridia bacterium]
MRGIVNMKMKSFGANLILILAAFIWGSAFVAQNSAGDILGAFSINFARNVVGSAVLIPVYFFFSRKEDKKTPEYKLKMKNTFIGGLFCGLALFAASAFQQLGINIGKDEGKAGFITVMYVVIVPLIGLIFKKRVSALTWLAVAIAPVGLYFLCIEKGFSLAYADILLLICAFIFSIHISVIDHFSPKADGVLMSCVQFFVAGVLSLVCMLVFEAEYIRVIPSAWIEILYLGIMSSGVAYTLQIIGQKNTNPTVASILLSLESVFAMICGAIFSQTMPDSKKILGAVIIFAAVILAQMPAKVQSAKCKV